MVLFSWPIVVGLHYLSLTAFGVPRMSWRYMTMLDTVRIFVAIAVPATILIASRLLSTILGAQFPVIPLGVLAMHPVLAFVGLVGTRASWRLRSEVQQRKKRAAEGVRHRVLLIGAGEAGVLVAREIANRPDLNLHPVGFLDDDPLKVGTSIAGLQVLGTTAMVAEVAERKRVKRALITIANAPGHQIRRITELCSDAGLDTKIIPGIYEIVGDEGQPVADPRSRDRGLARARAVQLDEAIIGGRSASRVVLVTGAGGSIGSELCRQVCRFGPNDSCSSSGSRTRCSRSIASCRDVSTRSIEPRVADVCDEARMEQMFTASKPELVFHAAAHKHVPMMEWNPGEAVKNNVGARASSRDLADRFRRRAVRA